MSHSYLLSNVLSGLAYILVNMYLFFRRHYEAQDVNPSHTITDDFDSINKKK